MADAKRPVISPDFEAYGDLMQSRNVLLALYHGRLVEAPSELETDAEFIACRTYIDLAIAALNKAVANRRQALGLLPEEDDD